MGADELLLRVVSTLPEALGAWIAAAAGLRLLRVRDPRVRSAVWTLATIAAAVPLAGAGSVCVVTARVAVAPGFLSEGLGVAAAPALAVIAGVGVFLVVRRIRTAVRLESLARSLVALWPAPTEGTCLDVRLAAPPGDGSPFVAGFLRPVVVVPAAFWGRLAAGERRAVVAHEHAHLQRLDVWRSLAEGICADLLWFNPFVRLFATRAADEREALADRGAVRRGASPADLARAIVAAASCGAAPAGATAFGGRRAGALERRLELLRPSRRAGLVAAAQAAALVVLLPWSPAADLNGVRPARAGELRDGARGAVTLGLAWRTNPVQQTLLSFTRSG